jgi:hypothetical protein
MPKYAKLNRFMKLVKEANPEFERRMKSSLRPVINLLESDAGTPTSVFNALKQLPAEKIRKYRFALYYLLATYPQLPMSAVNFGTSAKTEAVRFSKTPLPPDWNSWFVTDGSVDKSKIIDPKPFYRLRANQITSLGQTVENFLLTPGIKGIVLIHMAEVEHEITTSNYDGWSGKDHINSVLRVGSAGGHKLCVLTQGDREVCPGLEKEVEKFGANKLTVTVPGHHMGGRNPDFLSFAKANNPIVVMGFDATVCVTANMFGCPEQLLTTGAWVEPLVSLAAVVTSRAVLVGSDIDPIDHRGEWGPLWRT